MCIALFYIINKYKWNSLPESVKGEVARITQKHSVAAFPLWSLQKRMTG